MSETMEAAIYNVDYVLKYNPASEADEEHEQFQMDYLACFSYVKGSHIHDDYMRRCSNTLEQIYGKIATNSDYVELVELFKQKMIGEGKGALMAMFGFDEDPIKYLVWMYSFDFLYYIHPIISCILKDDVAGAAEAYTRFKSVLG